MTRDGDIDDLLAALADPDDEVSARAARELGARATEAEVPALVREFVDPDRCPETWVYDNPYLVALVEMDSREAYKPLVETLAETANPEVVNRCIRLLEELGDVSARPALEELLAEIETEAGLDEDEFEAVKAHGTALLTPTTDASYGFRDEDDLDASDVRAMKVRGASWVLDGLEVVEAQASEQSTLAEIRRGLEDREYDERLHAENRLRGWIGAVDTETLIVTLRDPNNKISAAAAKSLGVRGASDAIPGLVREVSREKRCIATDVVQYQYAEESDLEHSEHARALVRIGDRSAVGPLLDALDSVDEGWVKWDIAWVLARLEDPRALEPLEAQLEAYEERDGHGWRYRALVSGVNQAVARLRHAAERDGERA